MSPPSPLITNAAGAFAIHSLRLQTQMTACAACCSRGTNRPPRSLGWVREAATFPHRIGHKQGGSDGPWNFVWNELYTATSKAKVFYAATIGWTFDGMPMPNSTSTYGSPGGRQAGRRIMDMRGIVPEEAPPHWSAIRVDMSISVSADRSQCERSPSTFRYSECRAHRHRGRPTGAVIGG